MHLTTPLRVSCTTSLANRPGARWLVAALLTVATCLAACVVVPNATAAGARGWGDRDGAADAAATGVRPPADFFGIGDWQWPSTEVAAQYAVAGVKTVRAGLAWDRVEHAQGQRKWDYADRLLRDAALAGFDLTWAINGCAAWSCGIARTAPQTDLQRAQFQSFVAEAVARYGASGSFWRANRLLRPATINWQVWNEVNVGQDWLNPTAAGYAQMLRETSATIRAGDPTARVITSGLAEMPVDGTGATLSAFLSALEQQPGFQTSADVVAVHGYAADPAGLARILDTTRRIMTAAGDHRPIWVTELGWASDGPAHEFSVGPEVQAKYLRDGFDMLYACRDRWALGKAFWFSLQDISAGQLGEPDFWGLHTGLLAANGSAKPALAAFREYIGGRALSDGRGASCGLAGGASVAAAVEAAKPPVVTIDRAPTLVGLVGPSLVEFSSTVGALGRTECSVNGGAWTVCSSPWAIPRAQEGVGTLSVRGIDRTGTPSVTNPSTSWTVDLTPPKTVFAKAPPKTVRAASVLVAFGIQGAKRSAAGVREALGAAGKPEPITYSCSFDKSKWAPCNPRYRAKTKVLGKHILRVRAIDAAGNVDYHGAIARYTVEKAKGGRAARAKKTAKAKSRRR
ncbi:MAG: glycosyl hydrolase [Solirubrobacteraceae bacterium]|nr:glycosyl hydrolase [Solirubrobacteraceae bacterium]